MIQKRMTDGKKMDEDGRERRIDVTGFVYFQKLARESKATYKVEKVILVNMDVLEEYLEKNYREFEG